MYRRKIWGIILAALFVVIGAPNAPAQTTSYTIDFTTSPPGGSPLPSGSFVYDHSSNQFLSFTVHWDGFRFNLTSSANNPYIESGGPPCVGGDTGAMATLKLMTVCGIVGPSS